MYKAAALAPIQRADLAAFALQAKWEVMPPPEPFHE